MQVLKLEAEILTILQEICDVALKSAGMAVHSAVQKVIEKKMLIEENLNIEIDKDLDKALYEICDASLKECGFIIHSKINKLITSVKEKELNINQKTE